MKPEYNSNPTMKIAVTLFLSLSLVISVRYLLSQEQMINRIELLLVQLQFYNTHLIKQLDTNFNFSPYIAHGGGDINGLKYTNSLEALRKSYNDGFRLIEVDLFLTADKQIVLLHDNPDTINSIYLNYQKELNLENFKKLQLKDKLTPVSFDDLINFMAEHPDLYIITDHKNNNNLEILTIISEKYPDYKNRIIPQIYWFRQYYPALKLGYTKIILSLYRSHYPDELLFNFLSRHNINILTVSQKRISENFIAYFKDLNLKIYTHPVDQATERDQLFKIGIDGIYTSSLTPISK